MPSAPASNAGSTSPGVPKLARHLHAEAVACNRRQALPLCIFRIQNVLFRQSPAESATVEVEPSGLTITSPNTRSTASRSPA
jgi:hypothetical protein